MANMSYCRFQNTAQDLQDCVNNWPEETDDNLQFEDIEEEDDDQDDDVERLSPDEERARRRIVDLAREILELEGYNVERD